MKRWVILFFVFASMLPVFAADTGPLSIGSGEPGLKIVYKTTNQFVIYRDEPGTVGAGFVGGYYDRHIDVLFERNYGLKEKIQTRKWHADPQQLYPFDDETVFTCEGDAKFPNDRIYKTNSMGESISDDGKTVGFPRITTVFSTNIECILISHDVYAMARLRYALTTNQLFLGRIGTNIFYWEPQNATQVYYRGVVERNAKNYFKLPKRVLDLYGVTKAISKNKEIGVVVFEKSPGFINWYPYTFGLVELSFKDTKRVKGGQK